MNERQTMDKRELMEMGTVGSLGGLGVGLPQMERFAEFFTGITPIASFFLILVPTGIWAWCRAIQYIREHFRKE